MFYAKLNVAVNARGIKFLRYEHYYAGVPTSFNHKVLFEFILRPEISMKKLSADVGS